MAGGVGIFLRGKWGKGVDVAERHSIGLAV